MEEAAELILVPVLVANLWHTYLVLKPKHNKPNTISEHALLSHRRLLLHRLFHCLSSAAMLLYAYVNRDLFGWITLLLVAGAIFDVIEVLTLNKSISKSPTDFTDPHQLTSWLMANSYLAFVIFAGIYTDISNLVTVVFTLAYVSLFVIAVRMRFKNFWVVQLVYFIVLVINMIVLSLHV